MIKKVYIKPICRISSSGPMTLLSGSGDKNTGYTYGEKDVNEGTVKDDEGQRDSEAKEYRPWSVWDDS